MGSKTGFFFKPSFVSPVSLKSPEFLQVVDAGIYNQGHNKQREGGEKHTAKASEVVFTFTNKVLVSTQSQHKKGAMC